ncbi:hypothetical protein MRI28_30955 [Nocardiopsis dassonvillei]|uniref:hypothetical protein n=1 Tax=Nocardiopsis dassonvillei TaxID=2014 RepID=UPI00200CBB8E|nr:hypothetical protein [Nocardiopsis dassonvillei]MCK9873987.1 hypothetical protein [Nocardiopsis dassonvillei]
MRDTVRVPPWLRTTLWALRWLIVLVAHGAALTALLMGLMTAFPDATYGLTLLTMGLGALYGPVQLLGLVMPLCTAGAHLADARGGSRVLWSLLLALVPLALTAVVLAFLVPPWAVVYVMYFATGLLLSTTAVYAALPGRPERNAHRNADGAALPIPDAAGKP